MIGRTDVAALRRAHVWAGAAYAVAMAAVAVVAAWPIYADARLVVLAAAAVGAALVIGLASVVWHWPGWAVLAAGIVAFAVLGVTLAVPPAGVRGLPASLAGVATGAVTGFKDLVTVDLPVGTYRNLLVPALVVFLAGTLVVMRGAFRENGSWAAAVAVGMTGFGLLFGRTVTSEPLVLGPVAIPAPRELACGALALVLSIAWLAWRMAARRRAALRRAAGGSGVRIAYRRSAAGARRAGLAAGMVVVAVVVGAAVTPALAAGRTRDVLRSGAGPAHAISRAVSPLTDYRANFSGTAFSAPLFTVSAVTGPLPDRLRLATLASYDGTVYRMSAGDAADFVRVPAELPGGSGVAATVRITIDGLRGIWIPTFGSLRQVHFAGAAAASRADAFYYDAEAEAGVQADGLRAGETYELTATTDTPPPLAQLRSPGRPPQAPIPDSVKTWIDKQDAGTGGAGLATLVQRLRARGYLSHSLTAPPSGASWMSQLGPGYVFAPSASGHSLARIDAMFQALLTRQAEAHGGSLVAAPGDDEQFAVAVALIAQQLGFPARVVVGVRLTGEDGGVPPCAAGVCRGADVAAWTEVQGADGAWVAVDVTPQHAEGAQSAVTRRRDPEIPTRVHPLNAQAVEPPDAARQDSGEQAPRADDGAGPAVLWAVLRIAGMSGLGALVLIGPFAAILAAKAVRRRGRRRGAAPGARVVGGWEEYVDTAVDHGLAGPGVLTRTELAAAHASESAAALAVAADRAVFSDAATTADESARFWRLVDAERKRLADSRPLVRRVLAALSLKSFTRGLAPRPASRRARDGSALTPSTERRGRAPGAASAAP